MSAEKFPPADRSWKDKFADSFRGLATGLRSERSFRVHLAAAVAAVAVSALAGLDSVRWSLIVLCIATVLAAEMFNTALERLGKAVDRQSNPHVRDALDLASGAVLVASAGAAVVGALVLLEALAARWL